MRWDQNSPWRGYRLRSSNNYPDTWAVVVWTFWLLAALFSACCHCRYLCCVLLLQVIVTKVRASGVMMLQTVLDPLEHSCFSVKLHTTCGPAWSISRCNLCNALNLKDWNRTQQSALEKLFCRCFFPQIYPNLGKVTFNYLGNFRVGSLSEEKDFEWKWENAENSLLYFALFLECVPAPWIKA